MMECPVPVIAAVNGKAYGGGLEMILAADFSYGVESANLLLKDDELIENQSQQKYIFISRSIFKFAFIRKTMLA